ncbi:MAG: alkaline phosphatase family protein [Candidatus Tumulicola sp.]
MKKAALVCFAVILAAACSGTRQGAPAIPSSNAGTFVQRHSLPTPIQHIVIIFQENRTPDYLFNGMLAYGANIATTAVDSNGDVVQLAPISLAVPWDLGHGHKSFVNDCDMQPSNTCRMDGFDKGIAPKFHLRPFGYAPASEVKPYMAMATQYVFADNMYQTNQAGSFPAHQYIISGDASGEPATSYNVSSDPFNSKTGAKTPAGCDAPKLSVVDTIDPVGGGPGPTPFPCFERPVLSDLLDGQHVSWRYYQNGLGAGLWHGPDAIQHIRYGKDYKYVVTPPQTILTDATHGRLPGVAWVMPADGYHSDHSGNKSTAGPSWVAAVVNAIGKSKYWSTTAIVLTWDDWGGWYDHVPPQQFNSYELSFRVPMVIISPYAKMGASREGYISHVQYEFGSILAFAEETFGIPKGSLGSTDVRANDLSDAFDFTQAPRPFVKISAPPFVPKGDTIPDEDP